MPRRFLTPTNVINGYLKFQEDSGHEEVRENGMRFAHGILPAVLFADAAGTPLCQDDTITLKNLEKLSQEGVEKYGTGFRFAAEAIQKYLESIPGFQSHSQRQGANFSEDVLMRHGYSLMMSRGFCSEEEYRADWDRPKIVVD